MRVKYNRKKKSFKTGLWIGLILALFFMPQTVKACCSCVATIAAWQSMVWKEAENDFDKKINQEFLDLERFLVRDLWAARILPVMMRSAEQLTVVAIQQAMIIGTFFDASIQMETQLLLQEIRAKAHKDYHPSVGMCEFGSLSKSIAVSERRGELTSVVLSQRSQDRQLGHINTTGMYGGDLDKVYDSEGQVMKSNRLIQFATLFCNEYDRKNGLANICQAVAWSGLSIQDKMRINKDIDYYSLMEEPWTLKINYTNNQITDTLPSPPISNEDEEHVMAMASNLFGYDLFVRIPPRHIVNKPEKLTELHRAYMDMRSIIAKRSVAENSFNAIAAMKSEGNLLINPSAPPDTLPHSARIYMEHVLTELGVDDVNSDGSTQDEILAMMGENPSYYAQMEVLTKKLYQNPDFYTNLYDKPVNVERKTTAMQAIKLMQKFDMLKSVLRDEATLSVLLELAVMDVQDEVEKQIENIDVSAE
ncbi:MAG: hypothetical protein OEY94_03880 [Alphaproteobacteria bacterium]|nr:hypothetical protein [Alphaproteobacteria bacterium]